MLQKLWTFILFASLSVGLLGANELELLKKYIPFAKAPQKQTKSVKQWPKNTLTENMCTSQFTYKDGGLYLVNVDGRHFRLLKIDEAPPTVRLKRTKSNGLKFKSVDLRPQQSPIKSQAYRSTCTVFTAVALMEYLIGKQSDLSEQDAYWAICKYIHRPATKDAGLWPENVANALSIYPICTESHWPYEDKIDTWIRPLSAVQNARHSLRSKAIFSMWRAENRDFVHKMLESGHCIVACFKVAWNNHVAAKTGKMDLVINPETGLPIKSRGGHSMLIVGYDENTKRYILKNSYGSDWGDKGYVHMSAAYFLRYAYGDWFTSSSARENKYSRLYKE